MVSTPVMQFSFNSGEWAPALNARVDIAKYHNGAALLRNFFVDYRGGATTRPGTKYILQTRLTSTVRLIPFQASFTISYVLEFGQGYIRFFQNGAPVLETATTISAANIGTSTLTDTAHGYSNGDWVKIAGIVGTLGALLNGNYYIIAGATTNTYTLTDLNGNAISFAGLAYTSGGSAQRVYTLLNSPYQANELAQIKFAQNTNTLILCHPNYPPYVLTLNSAANWSIAAITFGSTIAAPTSPTVASTFATGTAYYYAYVITAVDGNGQESAPSAYATFASASDLRATAGTNTVSWTAVAGAISYNVYKAEIAVGNQGPVPAGQAFGFIANVTTIRAIDSNIAPDFSQGPPVPLNPFFGSGVQTVNVTNPGAYGASTAPPLVTFTGGGGSGAAALASLQAISLTIGNPGSQYIVGDTITLINGIAILQVTGVNGSNQITSAVIISAGLVSGTTNTNPVVQASSSRFGLGASFNLTYGVVVSITSPGTGYTSAPTVGFSSGTGAATAVLGAPSNGNPTVPGFFQDRLVLAGPVLNPQQFNMSQPGSYYNFNVSNPIEADDAIQETLISGSLNTIQSMIAAPFGLIIFSDKQAWLINGGSNSSAVTPESIVANSQAYNGASYPPPIAANDNILYVQSKQSIVRDLVFNYYTQVYTGSDISVLSSHLFYGYQVLEWAWAEEPFKLVWAVRNDGTMLTLTFLKEQELIAWAHSDTQGAFKSVATVVESVSIGNVDAVYTVVQRTINGNTVQYIERLVELSYPNGVTSAWQVDCGLQYSGAAALTFSGAGQLAGATCTGLATDNLGNVTVITPFVMPTNGTFTLPAPTPVGATGYTLVTVGLPFTPQLQTLALDTGEPTIQGKVKKISGVTVRVENALGLWIGGSLATIVKMKDLIVGNVSRMLTGQDSQLVTDLVTGDAYTVIDPRWTVQGQYFITQPYPLPASILGVIPQITIGDTPK